MWVAVLVLAVGLLAVATITQRYGYRLGGTITIPVLAVYTLWQFVMLPVFVLSTVAAVVGLSQLRQRTLIHGRDELVAAILVGSLVPLVTLLFLLEAGADVQEVAFIGSILPGLAAYNWHRLEPEQRLGDVLATAGLFAGLVAIGWTLVRPGFVVEYGTLTPPVLYSSGSDIATVRGAVVELAPVPVILSRTIAVSLFAAGFAISEIVRDRYGVRIGIIAPVLLAIYLLANRWLIVIYVVTVLAAFAFVQGSHYLTLRYGRVLLGTTVALAVLLVLPLSVVFPVTRGLSALFVGVLAGVTAYNAHASPPIERRLVLPLQLVVFVPSLLIARLFAEPLARGVPRELDGPVLLVAGVVFALSLATARLYTVRRPTDEQVFEDSVLSLDRNP